MLKEFIEKPQLAEDIVQKYLAEYRLKFGDDKKEEEEKVAKGEGEEVTEV